jgi:hypothetical protein
MKERYPIQHSAPTVANGLTEKPAPPHIATFTRAHDVIGRPIFEATQAVALFLLIGAAFAVTPISARR